MAKRPVRKPNAIIDAIPSARRSGIEKVCAEHGTSIEKIPAWWLGLSPRNIAYRLKLYGSSKQSTPRGRPPSPGGAGPRPKPKPKPKPKPRPKPKPKPAPGAGGTGASQPAKRLEGKAVPRTQTGEVKIPNTPTGQDAIWWLKNVVSKVRNASMKKGMRRLIVANMHLPLGQFRKTVVSRIDEMLTEKKAKKTKDNQKTPF